MGQTASTGWIRGRLVVVGENLIFGFLNLGMVRLWTVSTQSSQIVEEAYKRSAESHDQEVLQHLVLLPPIMVFLLQTV